MLVRRCQPQAVLLSGADNRQTVRHCWASAKPIIADDIADARHALSQITLRNVQLLSGMTHPAVAKYTPLVTRSVSFCMMAI